MRRIIAFVLKAFVCLVLALYVLLNLLIVNFAPVLHRVTVVLKVEDADTSTPLSAAEVSWVKSKGYTEDKPIGVTDENGIIRFRMTERHQPLWFLPMVAPGDFRFSGDTLKICNCGHEERVIPLSSAVGRVPLGQKEVAATVTMRKE